jgi:hypothetical protein
MKKNQLLSGMSLMLALFGYAAACGAQMAISTSSAYTQLLDSLKSTGVAISNATYTGNGNSIGSFSNGQTTNLGLRSGVLMSTGKIIESGLAASYLGSNNFGGSGYSLLSSLAGVNTYDAAVLEFDVIPTYDTLSFNYIFGSEDYPENVGGTFFDPFGVFVSGKNPAGGSFVDQNFALLPNTNKLISINTINDTTNWQYYTSNTAGATIMFDGFTKVMTIKIPVKPGDTYHVKIALADGGDYIYDSGIFLKSHSLTSYGPSMGVSKKPIDNQIKIIGNPTNENSFLEFNTPVSATVSMKLYDYNGRILQEVEPMKYEGGSHRLALKTASLSTGVYTVELLLGDKILNQQVFVP